MAPVARTPSPARTCWTRDRESSRTALPLLLSPGVFGRRQGCDLASGALCRDRLRPPRFPAKIERRPPDPPPPPSRQRRRLHRTSAPSIVGDPLPPRFLRETRLREPASARPPGASLRLLQSNAICEHDLEPTEPRCLFWAAPGGAFPCGTRRPRVLESGIQRAALTGLDAAIALDRGRARWTGRPQSESTRAPSVANP